MRARFFTTRTGGRKLALWLWALLAALGPLLAGCSGERRYEVLSFFFDGVPDPNAPATGPGSGARRTSSGVVYFFHQPYIDGDCQECHQEETMRTIGRAAISMDICQNCHGDVAAPHAYVHGPVAAMACNQCHEPHRSRGPHLLRDEPRDLCLSCHDVRELSTGIAEHHDPAISCLGCHSGHGGADRDILRPDYRPGRPVNLLIKEQEAGP